MLPRLSLSPFFQWGEGRGEGRQQAPEQASTPHPNPLPVKYGERGLFRSPRHRALELAQHLVAATDCIVERLLGRLLAGQRRLDLLGPYVAQLHHVAESQASRVLGRLLVGEL